MRVLRLQTQGYKRLVAVDITPGDDPVVNVRGDNAEGKSSLLDSIATALGGADANPVKPIRTGEEFAAIRVTLGDSQPDIVVEKFFDEVGEKLRVTTADGAEFKAGQTKVGELLGRLSFDPLAFSRMNAKDQAAELRRIAPLSVDLDALAKADKADLASRRDVNRDGKALAARVDAIVVPAELPPKPDRDAITAALASAGDTNRAVDDERHRREIHNREREHTLNGAFGSREEAKALRQRAEDLDAQAARMEEQAAAMKAEADNWPQMNDPVDTAKLSADLAAADQALAIHARADERAKLAADLEALRAKSRGFTASIAERAETRTKALAEAKIPVEGLAFGMVGEGEDAELIVTYQGEPFEQASQAQQLRVSMALAIAANPKLRIMLIKEGAFLDSKGLALVRELAAGADYQVWLETVGEGDGTGLIIEGGAVRGAPEPERLDPPKRRKPKADEEQAAGPTLVEGSDGLARTPASDAPAPRPTRRKPSDLFGN